MRAAYSGSCGSRMVVLVVLRDGLVLGNTVAKHISLRACALRLSAFAPAHIAQPCWVHKTVHVLDKIPHSMQAIMKDLREVCWAPNRASAEAAIDLFAKKCRAKCGRTVECMVKDRDTLLYDFAAEHWDHLRHRERVRHHAAPDRTHEELVGRPPPG